MLLWGIMHHPVSSFLGCCDSKSPWTQWYWTKTLHLQLINNYTVHVLLPDGDQRGRFISFRSGGCPYAKAASGNVATEDFVYMLNGLGVKTNIVDLQKIMLAGNFICKHLGHPSGLKTAKSSSKITDHAP